jgi:nucleoside-triphosphatase THEP1
MPILFKFVNRYELFEQAKATIQKADINNSEFVEYNLFGYWGPPGIGKTTILNAIYSFLENFKIVNFKKYNCRSDGEVELLIEYLNNESKQSGVVIIDNLEEIQYEKYEDFRKACDTFIKRFIPRRVIFCASRLPDRLTKLLRPEQRLIIQLDAMEHKDTLKMLDQIFPEMSHEDKKFLNEYAVGYPQMISVFCCLLQNRRVIERKKRTIFLGRLLTKIFKRKNQNTKNEERIIEIGDKRLFLWEALLELAKSLNPDLKALDEKERFMKRMCFLSLFDGFMPEIGKKLFDHVASITNLTELKFERYHDFQNFIQSCLNYSLLKWIRNDYILYRPLKYLLRRYLADFENDYFIKINKWLIEQYTIKIETEKTKDKGNHLLKLTFYKHQLSPFSKEAVFSCLSNEVTNLENEENYDALEILNREIKNSEIGKIFNIYSISEIKK